MVSINWCLKQKEGIRLIEPNDNMAYSYIQMAEESIDILDNVSKSSIWTASAIYYIFYYSLYSLMQKIGIKSEIHSCSIEFMKQHLTKYFSDKDITTFESAFSARINLQYYSNRPVNNEAISLSKVYSKEFFIKTKDILSKIRAEDIASIRDRLKTNL